MHGYTDCSLIIRCVAGADEFSFSACLSLSRNLSNDYWLYLHAQLILVFIMLL